MKAMIGYNLGIEYIQQPTAMDVIISSISVPPLSVPPKDIDVVFIIEYSTDPDSTYIPASPQFIILLLLLLLLLLSTYLSYLS